MIFARFLAGFSAIDVLWPVAVAIRVEVESGSAVFDKSISVGTLVEFRTIFVLIKAI